MTHITLFIAMPGLQELILIIVIVILFFGAKKIPELMRGLGKGINEFKKEKEGNVNEVRKAESDL